MRVMFEFLFHSVDLFPHMWKASWKTWIDSYRLGLQQPCSWLTAVPAASPTLRQTVKWNKQKNTRVAKKKGVGDDGGGGGWVGAKKRRNILWKRSQRSSPRLPPRSVLSTSLQFKLAKGCNEVIVGPLVICQLHVSRPDHHRHVHPGVFSCFSLCKDKSTSVCIDSI